MMPPDIDVVVPPLMEAGGLMGEDAPPGGGVSGEGGASSGSFTCTLVIGILATSQWWNAGFTKLVNGAKWELIWVHSGFVELWANPNDPI